MSRLGRAVKAFWRAWQAQEEKETLAPPSKSEQSHLRLLTMLQRSGRLVDFIKEDISAFTDAQVGAAARQVHAECAKTLEEMVTIRPLYEEAEGMKVTLSDKYNASQVKLTGKVVGKPPYEGILVHRGWKAAKRSLPKEAIVQGDVICPAEIEIR